MIHNIFIYHIIKHNIMSCEIKVRKVDLTSYWSYDVENKECPVCHKDLLHPTNEAYEKRIIQNNITIGQCNHGAHYECINRWTRTNMSCPVCMTMWKPAKSVDSSVHIVKKAVIVQKPKKSYYENEQSYQKQNIPEKKVINYIDDQLHVFEEVD